MTARVHHFLSDNEYFAFLHEWYRDDTCDIREQFPLSLAETLKIAEQLGVRHPQHRGRPVIMTTDLLVTRSSMTRDLHVALFVKEDRDLLKRRTQEKCAIERVYWERRGVAQSIVASSSVKNDVGKTLSWIFENSEDLGDPSGWQSTQIQHVVQPSFAANPDCTMGAMCLFIDGILSLTPGRTLRWMRTQLGQRRVRVDLNCPSLTDLPCKRFSFIGETK